MTIISAQLHITPLTTLTLQINPTTMAKNPTLFLLCCLTNFILTRSDVLTLPLIHPLSPESPFFRANLTDEERLRTSVLQSNARANYFSKATRMEVGTQFYHYIIKIRIGTFRSQPPYKEYYLEMDTGSSLTWLQCDGCTKCFRQMQKPFPKQNSSSFHPLIINGKAKHFLLKYADGSSTTGQLAAETFYLGSDTGAGDRKVENLRFGCALESYMSYGETRNNRIAGLLGLGTSDSSLVKQLGHLSNGKFSYCLPSLSTKTHTYLTFGESDKPLPRTATSTALYTKIDADGYSADLVGISINGTRLNIGPQAFAGSSCVVDSGTPYSRIVSPAFDAMKRELEKYFSAFRDLKKVQKNAQLCYERSKPAGFAGLPGMTFHFRGPRADFVMAAEAVFDVVAKSLFRGEYFCLAMVRDEKMSILGSYQQTNQRIIYDTKNKQLVFYREDCSK